MINKGNVCSVDSGVTDEFMFTHLLKSWRCLSGFAI